MARKKRQYTAEEYDGIKAVNWSALKYMRESPLHYKHRLETPTQDTSAMATGRAAHIAITEPRRYYRQFAVWRGERRAGEAWDQFVIENEGKTILRLADHERAQGMAKAARTHPVAGPILALPGEAEKVIAWADPETGIRCKGRLDWLAGTVVDVKTTVDIEPRKFSAAAFRYGYVHQLAWYRWGLEASGVAAMPCQIIAIESEPPHDLAVYTLDEIDLSAALEEVHELLRRLKACTSEKRWPGRFETEATLQMPRWAWGEDDSATELGLIIKGAA